MKTAYVDTSCIVAIALGEAGFTSVAARLAQFDQQVSSNLLEAEFLATLAREGIPGGQNLLARIAWVHPDRSLNDEFSKVLEVGYLKGADLWHLACALFFDSTSPEITFVTLDTRQREIAKKLGFAT